MLRMVGLVCLVGVILCSSISRSEATLMDLIGVNGSIDKATNGVLASITLARDALLAIETKANEDVRDRLTQVDNIVDGAIKKIAGLREQTTADVVRILNETSASLNTLTDNFMAHLANRIRELECSAGRVLNDDLKDALGAFGELIGTNQMRISPPKLYDGEKARFCVGQCAISKVFDIKKPFQETYTDVKNYLLNERLKEAQDKTPINTVIVTYEFISMLAHRTTCFAVGSETRYQAESVHYASLARRWREVLGARVGLVEGGK